MRWSALGVGLVFGFLLTASGLGDYDTIHDGLLLQDPYIFLMMASAMATAFVGLAVLRWTGRTRYAGRLSLPHHRIERRHVYGGATFGLGFGVGATCPGMTVAMAATGDCSGSSSSWGCSSACGCAAGSSGVRTGRSAPNRRRQRRGSSGDDVRPRRIPRP